MPFAMQWHLRKKELESVFVYNFNNGAWHHLYICDSNKLKTHQISAIFVADSFTATIISASLSISCDVIPCIQCSDHQSEKGRMHWTKKTHIRRMRHTISIFPTVTNSCATIHRIDNSISAYNKRAVKSSCCYHWVCTARVRLFVTVILIPLASKCWKYTHIYHIPFVLTSIENNLPSFPVIYHHTWMHLCYVPTCLSNIHT